MVKWLVAGLLALIMCFDTVITAPRIIPFGQQYPRMSETQDLKCAIGTYGLDVSKELDDKMEAEVNRLLRLAKYIYGKDVVVVWGYSFSMYRPKIGGSTFTVEGISFTFFNPVYLNKYRDDFINVVVRHEISHAVVDVIYPNAKEAHGAEWISVMKALGDKNPQKYHTYTFCAEDNGRLKLPIILGL